MQNWCPRYPHGLVDMRCLRIPRLFFGAYCGLRRGFPRGEPFAEVRRPEVDSWQIRRVFEKFGGKLGNLELF